ncbi:MAG: GNAT family N-acetyltransferase [Gammaproteobacteria bacterium]
MRIRESVPADAEGVSHVLRRSITELCRADHKDNAGDLQNWLAGKTPAFVEDWISDTNNFCATVLADNGDIAGFGMVCRPGVLKLLYISPDHVGAGLGEGLLEVLEHRAREWGLAQLSLQSTVAAVSFYEAHGYRRADHIICRSDGISCHAMYKRLDE